MTQTRSIPRDTLIGVPQCDYCGGEGGTDRWMRLVWHDGNLYHDGCLGDIERDREQAAHG